MTQNASILILEFIRSSRLGLVLSIVFQFPGLTCGFDEKCITIIGINGPKTFVSVFRSRATAANLKHKIFNSDLNQGWFKPDRLCSNSAMKQKINNFHRLFDIFPSEKEKTVDPSPCLGQKGFHEFQYFQVPTAGFLLQLLTLQNYSVSLQNKVIFDCSEMKSPGK